MEDPPETVDAVAAVEPATVGLPPAIWIGVLVILTLLLLYWLL